jgi:hypothetical protein
MAIAEDVDAMTMLEFEKYFLDKQQVGFTLVAIRREGGRVPVLIFERPIVRTTITDAERNMMTADMVLSLPVAPWKMYWIEPLAKIRMALRKGDVFATIRLGTDWSEDVHVGDHIEFTRRETLEVFGEGDVLSVKRTRIKHLAVGDQREFYRGMVGHKGVDGIVEYLSFAYGQPVTKNDVVSVIRMMVV